MSLMDSVFDVRAALEGKPEAKLFEEIEETLWRWETEAQDAQRELHNLKRALATVGAAMFPKVES